MIEWSTKEPDGVEVLLKKTTLYDHILGDHNEKDQQGREIACRFAKFVVEDPKYIITDQSSPEDRKRLKYLDTKYIEETGKIRYIVVVAEANRDPREVVTVEMQRCMTDSIPKEAVIYDRDSSGGRKI